MVALWQVFMAPRGVVVYESQRTVAQIPVGVGRPPVPSRQYTVFFMRVTAKWPPTKMVHPGIHQNTAMARSIGVTTEG